MRLPCRTLALVAGGALVAAAGDEAPSSHPPVAALLPAMSFSTESMGLRSEERATVSPSPAVDNGDHLSTETPPPEMKESPFSLVRSASSNDAVDLLEIVRTNTSNAPRVSFESMTNRSAWAVDHWDNPLTLLSNMIANEHIAVDADSVRVAVNLTEPAKAVNVAFTKTNEWHYGPTLVLGDHALDGLTRIKQLEFSNFNVSFEGSKWLPPDTTLKKLAFNHSTVASFAMDQQYTVLRLELRDSTFRSFPAWLLQQATYAEALTIEKCNFSEPLTLSAKDLETLQVLPGVTLSANSFPKARTADCVETALYEGYDVCLTTPTTHANEAELPPRTYPPEEDPSVGATADGPTTPHPSVPLETLPPTAPLSGASLSSSRNAAHTLIGVLGVVCIIALVIGFIWLRRRKAAAASASYDHDESAVSYHSDKFYQQADADATDDDDELGFARDARYSQRTTTVGMGYLSDVDLGRHAVRGEMRLGTNKLWRADYRGETVAAMQVNIESLRERDRDIEAVVASCVALRHPNVVEFLGTSMGTGEEMWLVAEYMTRGSLCSIMATSKLTDLTWETLHRLSLQLATALAFVQSMRDAMTSPRLPTLSSRSVLFDDELNCKLDIFEFAQSVRYDAQPILSYGQGEIPYRAPELLRHALYTPTATSLQPLSMADVATAEVFALGAVLCELSLQSPLYSDITDTRGLAIGEIFIARQVAEGRLRPAPAANVPVDMARLIDACLAYEPAERPTIEQIVRQLVSMDVGN